MKMFFVSSSLSLFRCPFQTGHLLLEKKTTSQLQREMQKTGIIIVFHVWDVFYLRCPLCAGFGRCCSSVSAWAAWCRGSCWVWADSWRRGCRAAWEASGSEETSDTAGGTSCRRWFWCLQGAAAEERWLSANRSSMFLVCWTKRIK